MEGLNDMWEVWEFSSDHQFTQRHGVVSIRTYPSESEARADMRALETRENERQRRHRADKGYAEPFPRHFQARPATVNRRKNQNPKS